MADATFWHFRLIPEKNSQLCVEFRTQCYITTSHSGSSTPPFIDNVAVPPSSQVGSIGGGEGRGRLLSHLDVCTTICPGKRDPRSLSLLIIDVKRF